MKKSVKITDKNMKREIYPADDLNSLQDIFFDAPGCADFKISERRQAIVFLIQALETIYVFCIIVWIYLKLSFN